MDNPNWFHDLFIQEAKAAKEYHSGSGGESVNNQDKTITENGEYTADEGYTGFGTVKVEVPVATYATERWAFTMEDGSTVTKEAVVAE